MAFPSGNPFAEGAEAAEEAGGEVPGQGLRDIADGADGALDVADSLDSSGACDSCNGGCDGCGDGCDGGSCDCLTAMTWRLAVIAVVCLLAPGRRGVRDRLLRAVHRYRAEVSPKRPPCCRYTPTCSTYAVAALERHGAAKGTYLTARRLRRCRPGGKRGHDPVPE
jgi:putative membrane protein insertion efficiency factor